MPYIVFALKWRPKGFDEIIGQDHIVSTLKSAIQKKRLANAYLFAGPRGVGKTSTARIMAKALNCKEGPTENPCGKCSPCLEIAQGRSLDVMEIDGASNRGIDEIRALRENVKFAPTQGKYKIYIIDEVHQITTDGFNALLKTLEEPPEFVKFIFATTQPNKVIPTVLSRCQRLDFRRISAKETAAQLKKITAAENIEADDEVLFAIARSCDGSMRDAESILDQLASFSKGRISLKETISVLGIVEQEALFKITDKIIQKDAKSALELFNDIINEGKDTAVFLNNLIEHFRNLMVVRIARPDSGLIDLPKEDCDRLWQQAQNLSLEEIFSAFNILVNTQEMARRLESLRIPLEISLIKLAHNRRSASLSPQVTVKDPSVDPVSKQKPDIEPQQSVVPDSEIDKSGDIIKKEHKGHNDAVILGLENVKSVWNNVIEGLGKIKMSVATYLNEGTPLKIERDTLTISLPKDHSLHKESLEKRENKAIIEKALFELLNVNLKIHFILSQDAPKTQDSRDNPFVKSAIAAFRGRVVKEE